MVERGLVLRKRDPEDARITMVDVTDAGRELDHLAGFYSEINDTLMQGFSASDRAKAFELLERMEKNAIAAIE